MKKRIWAPFAVIAAFALVAAACGDDDATPAPVAPIATAAPAATAAPTAVPAVAPAGNPTQLDVAMVLGGVKEEPYYSTLIDSVGRATAAEPHGLAFSLEVIENISFADGERVIRDLAQTGLYEMIIAHSTYWDSIAAVAPEFPDIVFVFSGSGNEPVGGNAYWIDVFIHEPAYLAGIMAGMMTETNQISGVAAFPFPNVNAPLNAFIQGAKSVNPDVTAEVTYIDSWFDPAKAKDAAVAQIASGSDMVYAERFGPFEAAVESDRVFAFGHFSDQLAISPDVVLTSPLAVWDPAFNRLVEEWWLHATEGKAYDAPMQRIMFLMRDGGSDLGSISDALPVDVKAAVDEAKAAILSGDLLIALNPGPVE